MPYIGQSPDTIVSRNSFNEFNFTAINTQVTFTGADNNNNTLEYNPGNVEVFLNGVRLEEADFTATNGTSVVLASGATAGDLLSIKAIIVFQVGDAVSKSSGGTFANNVSVTGTLTATSFSGFGGNLTGVNSDVVDDTTPQLGGNLDLNNSNITGTGNVNITGALTASTSVKGNQLTINAATAPADPASGEAFIYASKTSGNTGIRLHASGSSEVLEVRSGRSTTDLVKLINQGNASFQ